MPSQESVDDVTREDGSAVGRRRVLATLASGALTGLAGCPGSDDGTATPPFDTPTESPRPPSTTTRRATTPTDAEASATETSEPTTRPAPDRGPSASGPWPTAHADAANTGTVEAAGPAGDLSVRWRGHVSLETTTLVATGPDGPVATQRNGTAVAYDTGGAVRWRRRNDAGFHGTPAVAADGTVVVGTDDGAVRAYDPDGTERWTNEASDWLSMPHVNDATPFRIAGRTVVFATPGGDGVALSLADGTVRWTADVPIESHRPAVADGRAFFAGRSPSDGNSRVVARSLSDGTAHWGADVDGSVKIAPGVHDGVVYVATIDGLLTARSAADGSEQWRVRIEGEPWIQTIPVVFGGRVWVGTLSAGFYGLTEQGVEAHVDVETATTPAVGDGYLYVGSEDDGSSSSEGAGSLVALDADGAQQWRVAVRGRPWAQVHYRNGGVVVGTSIGVVERFTATDGERSWRVFDRPAEVPSPVVGPATVYCGGFDGYVDGYRVTDGTSHLWRAGFDGSASGTPAVAGETVVAGGHGGTVLGMPPLEYADPPTTRLTRTATPDPDATSTPIFDAPLPDARWQTRLDGPVGDVGYGAGSAYLGAGTDVVSLTVDGDVRWDVDAGGPVRDAPAVVDETVYTATTDGTVLALASGDGTERWRRDVGAAATAPAVVRSGGGSRTETGGGIGTGTLVVGTDSGTLALVASDGSDRWRTGTARVRGTPAVTDRLAVVGDVGGTLRGLAVADGTERWRTTTGGAIHGAPAVADGTVYVGSRDSHLYAVRTEDGAVEGRVELADWVDGSPAVAYGAVFVADQSGTLSVVVGDR